MASITLHYITWIFVSSVGIEADGEKVALVVKELAGKNLEEVMVMPKAHVLDEAFDVIISVVILKVGSSSGRLVGQAFFFPLAAPVTDLTFSFL